MKQIGRQATGWCTDATATVSVPEQSIAGFRFCVRKSDQLQRAVDRPFQGLVALDPRTALIVTQNLHYFDLNIRLILIPVFPPVLSFLFLYLKVKS